MARIGNCRISFSAPSRQSQITKNENGELIPQNILISKGAFDATGVILSEDGRVCSFDAVSGGEALHVITTHPVTITYPDRSV
jgi:hypothetical protein